MPAPLDKDRWLKPSTPKEGRELQEKLREKIRLKPLDAPPPETVCGLDAAYSKTTVYAAACLMSFPSLKLIEKQTITMDIAFPYVPGLLTYREAPALAALLEAFSIKPDLLLMDGQGIAHPRGIGIASHLGVVMNIPSVGSAKSRLFGTHTEPGEKRGSRRRLIAPDGSRCGTVLRTRTGVKPLYVSPGHLVDFDDSVSMILKTTRGFREPEPLRCAHRLAGELKKKSFRAPHGGRCGRIR